ncbi:MAG: hypothetical protein HY831_00865 [Candidatus Aenigmarchaeota archaeon]|nr:hypothetical protein [Candidatus Aenigmarchaeota archaeon]
MQCVIAGSYGKFYKRILGEVIPVFERAGIHVPYPPKSEIVSRPGEYPIFREDERFSRDVYKSEILPVTKQDIINMFKQSGNPVEQIEKELGLEQVFLEAAENSNFIYLFNPEGYVGEHTSFELGRLSTSEIPIHAFSEIRYGATNHIHALTINGLITRNGGPKTPEQLVEYLIEEGKLKIPA